MRNNFIKEQNEEKDYSGSQGRMTVGYIVDSIKALKEIEEETDAKIKKQKEQQYNEKKMWQAAKLFAGLFPGAGTVVKLTKIVRDVTKKNIPDREASKDPILLALDIDDEYAAMLDDNLEEEFINKALADLESLDRDAVLPDMDKALEAFVQSKHKRMIDGAKLTGEGRYRSGTKLVRECTRGLLKNVMQQTNFDLKPKETIMRTMKSHLRRSIRKSLQLETTSHERETGLPSEFVEDNWLPWLDERGLGAEDLDDLAQFTGAPDRSWLPAEPPADGMDGPADLEKWARYKKTGIWEGKMRITKRQLRRIIRESLNSNPDLYPGQFGQTDYSGYSLDDLEYKHNQMMGSLNGQLGTSTFGRSDMELAGEEIADIRIQMAKLRSDQGLPEKDYSSNTYHEAERVVQGEIKFRKRGY